MEDGSLARVIYAFNTDIEGELNLRVGDIVQIDHAVDRHWYHGRRGQSWGNFPAGFVVEAQIPDTVEEKPPIFVASDNFRALEPGDLGFNKNDVIIGLHQIDANWWKGEVHGYNGIFPLTHAWQVDTTKMKKKNTAEKVNLLARVKTDMKAQLDEEMDLVKGDMITITEVIDTDWMRGECNGKSGIFPSSFVVLLTTDDHTKAQHTQDAVNVYPPLCAQPVNIAAGSHYSNFDAIESVQPSSTSSSGYHCDNSGITPYGVAQFSFVAQYPDELSFDTGEIVTLIRHVDQQWLEGEINGKIGYFPKSHVNIIVDCSVDVVDNASNNDMNSLINVEIIPGVTEARVLYDYTAQTSEDLNLVEDELIYIYRRVNDEWYEAKDCQGKIGLCPANYLLLTHAGKSKTSSFSAQECNNNLYLMDKNEVCSEQSVASTIVATVTPSGQTAMSCRMTTNAIYAPQSSTVANVDITQRSRGSSTGSLRMTSFLRSDFTKPRSVSDSSALEKSIAKNMANFDSSLTGSQRNQRSTSFTNCDRQRFSSMRQQSFSFSPSRPASGAIQRQMSGDVDRRSPDLIRSRTVSRINGLPSTPPPRPLPPNLSLRTRSESVVPPRPPLPPPPAVNLDSDDDKKREVVSVMPPEVPPPPLILRETSGHSETLESESCVPPKIPIPVRAAPPPPVNVTPSNVGIDVTLRSHNNANGGVRVPQRPAPPPPSVSKQFMDEDTVNALDGLQRKIIERENTLKQLKNTKQELDSHLINRQANHDAMHDDVKAYEATIDGLSSEIHSLKESAHKFSAENETDVNNELTQNSIKKEKDLEKRKLVIRELLKTEQDYVKDLKLCLETFSRKTTKEKGVDVDALFGNLDEVIGIGQRLLDSLEKVCAELNPSAVIIGPCFQKIAPEMKDVYGHYCSNHEEVIQLLEKYQENAEIQNYIAGKINILREQTSCFSLGSLLIKPVQRILKYPLLLNELIKCTEDDHPDTIELQKAIQVMTDVATAINEYKRRRDLVVKYRKDVDTSFAAMISKFNLHSLVKKSNRIGMRFSSTIGLTSVTKDEAFDEEEHKFRNLDKTIKTFLKDVMEFCIVLEEWVTGQFHSAEHIAAIYAEKSRLPEIDQYRTVQRELFTNIWSDFKNSIANHVVQPLTDLLRLFQGPMNLIDKRYDKLLDYDSSSLKLQKNKDMSKAKMLREEQSLMKNTYEALNTQLLEELPRFFELASSIFRDSTRNFFVSRKRFTGRLTKESLPLMELPAFQSLRGDILEDFYSKHVDVTAQLSTLTFLPKNFFPQRTDSIRDKKTSKANANKENTAPIQLDNDCEKVKSQYPPPNCYCAIKIHQPADPFEVPLAIGDVVGVIKQQDPMGGTQRWYIDNGVIKGFVPADCLVPLATESQRNTRQRSTGQNSSNFIPGVKVGHGQPMRVILPEKTELPPPPYNSLISTDTEKRAPTPVYYETPPESEYESPQQYDIPFEDDSASFEDSSMDISGLSRDSVSPRTETDSRVGTGEIYTAAYDLHTDLSGTLSLTRGQQVLVLQKQDMEGNAEWWLIQDANGSEGFAPANYLMKTN